MRKQHQNAMPPQRFQFGLRWLFVAIAATAVCALVARQCGWIESLGVGIAFGLAAVALHLRGVGYWKAIRITSVIVAALIVWVVGAEYSVFRVGCEHCLSHWNVVEYRAFGVPVYVRKCPDHSPVLRQIAEDLGSPCPHQYRRFHLIRLWGFVYPHPCISGTCCLSGGDWYDSEDRKAVRALARQNPDLGREFRDRVILAHDHVYAKKFYADLAAARHPASTPVLAGAKANPHVVTGTKQGEATAAENKLGD